MAYLFTIYRQKDINLNGSVLNRNSVRGIIFSQGRLLMIKSRKYGEFKFPGGGIMEAESPFEAMYREILEETGYTIKPDVKVFGSTLEYAKDFEGLYDVFRQESTFYFCEIEPEQYPLHLDDYEQEYGYEPQFIAIEDAIENNEAVPSDDMIPWKERDTMILKLLKESKTDAD